MTMPAGGTLPPAGGTNGTPERRNEIMPEYSYEIDNPISLGGRRYSYGDHYSSRRAATQAMRDDMADSPDGSTAIVYLRDEDGDICDAVGFVKQTKCMVLRENRGESPSGETR